ncbi:hypothetical protein Goari_003290, partial [Gossypium aridum]|nr:hypothetical protein [Gossypium aridum]
MGYECYIGYGVLFNQITSLWKPSQSFHLVDMENGYYLGEFATVAKRSTPTTSDETFGPWMIVKLKSRQSQVDNRNHKEKTLEKILNVSRFTVLEKDKARMDGEQVEFMGT